MPLDNKTVSVVLPFYNGTLVAEFTAISKKHNCTSQDQYKGRFSQTRVYHFSSAQNAKSFKEEIEKDLEDSGGFGSLVEIEYNESILDFNLAAFELVEQLLTDDTTTSSLGGIPTGAVGGWDKGGSAEALSRLKLKSRRKKKYELTSKDKQTMAAKEIVVNPLFKI